MKNTNTAADQAATQPKRKPIVRKAPKPPAELKTPGEVNAFCSGVILAGNAIEDGGQTATARNSDSQLELELAAHSRDTGVPPAELKRMCLRAGLDLLNGGGLTVRNEPPERLPIFLPRNVVLMLRELCGPEGADLDGGADGFVDSIIGEMARDYPTTVPDFISDAYVLTNRKDVESRMLSIANAWEGRL